MKSVTFYPFNMAAGQAFVLPAEGEYFRIQSSAGSVSVTIEGSGTLPDLQAGQGIKNTPFKRLILRDTSGAANSGIILVGTEDFIDNRTYGVNSISGGSIDLTAATINSIARPVDQTGFFSDLSTPAANTPITIFSPGSNLNGALLLNANLQGTSLSSVYETMLHKASAPTSIADGSIVMVGEFRGTGSGGAFFTGNTLQEVIKIPAGQGLYCICNSPLTTAVRSARFRLL